MCRLVVCGPDRQLEIAVPVQVPLADLLPTLLTYLGPDLADSGMAHAGWVLQRLGEPPFDEDLGVGALGLRDGELVHLRPRADQLPPAAFDDLIDGIATGLRQRPGLWRPSHTRWAALTAAALVLTTGLVALAFPGPPQSRTATAVLLALTSLAGTAVAARAVGDRPVAGILAAASVGYAFLAGLLAPQIGLADPAGLPITAENIFAAASAGTGTVLLAGLLAGGGAAVFVAGAVAGTVTAVGAGVVAFTDVPASLGAALVAVLVSVLLPFAPLTATLLAGLRMGPLPTEPEHLQQDIDPEPAAGVLARTRQADAYLTGLYGGIGAAAAAAVAVLAVGDGWAEPTLAGLVAVVSLLSVRPMTSAWHRLAAGLPGLVGPVAVVLALLGEAPVPIRVSAVAVGMALAVPALTALARLLPGRRLMPYWGRIGDILQVLAGVAQLPVLLTVAGAYGWARGLGG